MARITFDDKEATKTSTKPRKNLITYEDINEVKSVVNENANINEISTDEQVIGKLGNKTLYRKKLSFPKNSLTITNGVCDIDITSLGAKKVFVNTTYTYLENQVEEEETTYYVHYPVNSCLFNNATSYNAYKNETFTLQYVDNEQVSFYIGTSRQSLFTVLVITLEYTKD